MGNNSVPSAGVVFTIGHSSLTMAEFIGLLRANEIKVLIDIRSQPYSKYSPHFNSAALQAVTAEQGLQFLLLGRELGGRPTEREYYDDDGYVLYYKLALAPNFLAGMARLEQIVATARTAILCSEENPEQCHRHLLVGKVLAERGLLVYHIRSDGRIQTAVDLAQASDLGPGLGGQLELFETGLIWRSPYPVLSGKKGE